MPFITCLLLSHDKPAFVGEAINSLLAQTFTDWEAIVFDSGVLYDQGLYSHLPGVSDSRLRLVRSWETEELRKTKTIASWCFNECFRKGLVKGDYVTYLCDDDLLYPNAFQAFFDYARAHPEAQAMYAGVDMTAVNDRGELVYSSSIPAEGIRGRCCQGGPLDCQVDYLQLCHKADLFQLFSDDEYWPENLELKRHADGVFMEKIGSLVPIFPVPAKIGQNRKVPSSINAVPIVQHLELMQQLQHCRAELEEQKKHTQQLVAENLRLQQVLAQRPLRYRLADRLNRLLKGIPLAHGLGKRLVLAGGRLRIGRTWVS
jgi:spore maturation protein CgeD